MKKEEVVRELVVSLDKCHKDHLLISFDQDATLGVLLVRYGRMVGEHWFAHAQERLTLACERTAL